MAYVAQLVQAVRDNPMLGVGLAAAIIVIVLFLNRRPRMQREADEHLAAIRRDKAEQYKKLRPPR